MRALAVLEGGDAFESYTDKGRRALKQQAQMWLSVMREQGLVPIIVPKATDA